MTNVRIKNKILLLGMFLFLAGCKEDKEHFRKKQEKNINHLPLTFNITFENYGTKNMAFNKETISVDTLKWKNHKTDNIAYFNINLQNSKKEPFVIKTSLVANNIPFLIQYVKTKKYSFLGREYESYNVNIVQQFNTIYKDSILLINKPDMDFLIADQAFLVGYQKNGIESICQLPIYQSRDTIDISNPKNRDICCIEKK